MEWFRKFSPYDHTIYLNDEEIVLRKDMLVQNLSQHNNFQGLFEDGVRHVRNEGQ